MPNEFDPMRSGMGVAPPDGTVMYPDGRPQMPVAPLEDVQAQEAPPMQLASLDAPSFPHAYDLEGAPEEEETEEDKFPDAFELEKPVEDPKFLEKVRMLNTGVHRGVTHFTYKMMSMIPSEKLRGRIKQSDAALEKEHQKNIATGSYAPQAGEIAGEMLATMPLMSPYGGVMKGAGMVGKALPTGLKTAGKYGTAGAGGAALFGAMESQRYDPEHPGQLINKEAAEEAMSNPVSYAAPMIGAKLGAWADKSRRLQGARSTVKNILPRDVMDPSSTRTLSQTVFDSFPAITGVGKRVKQLDSIGDDVHTLISKVSGGNDALKAKNLTAFAGQKLQMGLKRIKQGQKEMWDKPFRKVVIADTQEVRNIAHEGMDILQNSGVPLTARASKLIEKGLQKSTYTVDDVKNLQGVLGDAANTVQKGEYGGLGRSLGGEISAVRQKLFDPIQKNLSGADLKDFAGARAYSSRMFEMESRVPQLKKALTDEVAARQLIKNLLSPAEKFKKADVMNIMSPRGQNAVKAAKVAQALEASDKGGRVSLTQFLKKTSDGTDMPELLGDSYTAVKGLNKYLTTIKEAGAAGNKGKAVLAGAAALGAAGAIMAPEDTAVTAAALVSYPVALFAANNPVAKRLFGAMTKNLSKSTYDYLIGKTSDLLNRSGYFMAQEANGDEVLKEKTDISDGAE